MCNFLLDISCVCNMLSTESLRKSLIQFIKKTLSSYTLVNTLAERRDGWECAGHLAGQSWGLPQCGTLWVSQTTPGWGPHGIYGKVRKEIFENITLSFIYHSNKHIADLLFVATIRKNIYSNRLNYDKKIPSTNTRHSIQAMKLLYIQDILSKVFHYPLPCSIA